MARRHRQLVVAPEERERHGRHRAAVPWRSVRAAASARPVQPSRRTSAGRTPAARQTSASSRSARARTDRYVASSQPVSCPSTSRAGWRRRHERTGRRATRAAGSRACRRRRRSAPRGSRTPPSGGTRSASTSRVTGWFATARASSGWPARVSQAADAVAVGEGARRIVGRGAPCRRRAAAPPPRPARRSTGIPRASIRAASQPATSATARACRTNQGGGSRESRREAASTRPGTVIGSMVPDGQAAAGSRWQGRQRSTRNGVGSSPVTGIAHRIRGVATAGRGAADAPLALARAAAGRPALGIGPSSRSPRTRRRPFRRDPSGRRARPMPRVGRGSASPDGRTGCRSRPRRPRSVGRRRVDERLCRRGLAAVMGDLEQVDVRQVVLEQRRVDALLDVAHQQEPALARPGRAGRSRRC